MINSYEEVILKEGEIRELLTSFPDALELNTICDLLLDGVEILNTDWSTDGSIKNISNLKDCVEELKNIILELTTAVDTLKTNTVTDTGYVQKTERLN